MNPGDPVTDLKLAALEAKVASLAEEVGGIKVRMAVVETQLSNLIDDVISLKRSFYTFGFSITASAVIFAFTTFALLGKP